MRFSPDRIQDQLKGRESLRVAVVADTHVPDRVAKLHSGLVPALENENVDLILHAGDICVLAVLSQLEAVAPVLAVRGNRDIFRLGSLPVVRLIELANIPVALMHGHGNTFDYLLDKWHYLWQGYRLERYRVLLERTVPNARVYIFGHTHFAENQWIGGRLFFNPGSASPSILFPRATFGIIQFGPHGRITARVKNINETFLKE